MQLRGGLLIEPWRAFNFYTDVPKEQSIVSFDDAIYVCSVAHQAGATFAENLDKFVAVGCGGEQCINTRLSVVEYLNGYLQCWVRFNKQEMSK